LPPCLLPSHSRAVATTTSSAWTNNPRPHGARCSTSTSAAQSWCPTSWPA